MDDAFGVGGIERAGHLDTGVEQFVKRQRAVGDLVLQRVPIEKFHGDEMLACEFIDFIDRADVGMIQRGGGARFALEALERPAVARHFGREKFQRDGAAKFRVDGVVDDAHTAAAKLFLDPIVRNRAT